MESIFGVDCTHGLDKANRLIYGESLMSHAMVLTACNIEKEGAEPAGSDGAEPVSSDDSEDVVPSKWRVENSWGEDRAEKGYICMSGGWFREYVFEVVVDRRFLPEDVLQVMEKTVHVLPAWDPLGALARNRITQLPENCH